MRRADAVRFSLSIRSLVFGHVFNDAAMAFLLWRITGRAVRNRNTMAAPDPRAKRGVRGLRPNRRAGLRTRPKLYL